jgi:hypothetical protein
MSLFFVNVLSLQVGFSRGAKYATGLPLKSSGKVHQLMRLNAIDVHILLDYHVTYHGTFETSRLSYR